LADGAGWFGPGCRGPAAVPDLPTGDLTGPGAPATSRAGRAASSAAEAEQTLPLLGV